MKPFLLILLSVFLLQSCKPRQNRIVKRNGKKDLISFASVFGIPYTEVSRRTSKGLSFNDAGYQLQPQWQITFLSNDSAAIYSPFKNKTINFPLTCGYDSIFNTARTWFKVKKLNKDSLKAELLTANGDSLDTKGAEVYLTFYSDNYIKNKLGKNAAILRHPSKADSAYIKQLSSVANTDITKSFAATQPVQLASKSKLISVKKEVTEGTLFNNFDTSDDYLNPTYDIVINKAYDDFFVYFSIIVDQTGQMHFGKPAIPAGEVYRDRCKNVMNGYLKYYLKVTPGNTLGIIHASEITVKCSGKKRLMANNRISKL